MELLLSKIDLPHWYVGNEDCEAGGKEISAIDDGPTKADNIAIEDIKPEAPIAPTSRLGPVPDFLKQKLAVVKGDGSDHEMDKEDDDKQDGDKPHMQHQHETKGLNLELLEAAQKFTGALVASPMTTTRSTKAKKTTGVKSKKTPMKKKGAKPKASAKAKAMPTVPTMVPYL